MLLEVFTFLSVNKAIITGAVACVGEIALIMHNLRKQWRAEKTARITHSAVNDKMIFPPEFQPKPVWRKVLWAANPINLFRDP